MYLLFIGGPLFIIRAGVGVEMAEVLGVQGVGVLGVDLEGVGPREGARGRVEWCGDLSTEASYGEQSWRPEVAVRRAAVKEETGSDVCEEEEPGCSGWTRHL